MLPNKGRGRSMKLEEGEKMNSIQEKVQEGGAGRALYLKGVQRGEVKKSCCREERGKKAGFTI